NSPFSSSSILGLFPPKTTTSTSLDNDDILTIQQPTLLSACISNESSGSGSSHSYSESGFCSSSLLSSSSVISASSSPPQSSSPSVLKRASSISIMPINIHSTNNNNILSTSSPTCSNVNSASSSPLTSYNNFPLTNHLLLNDSTSSSSSSSPQQQQQQQQQHHHGNNNNMQLFQCCPFCGIVYKKQNPARVLQCFHTICESCVNKLPPLSNGSSDGCNDDENENYYLNCPLCGLKTNVQNILPDYTIHNVLECMMPLNETTTEQHCTTCNNIESLAMPKCCSNGQRVSIILFKNKI
ncbi:unnamed protein product, partial [Didymodactylos carnosus]